MIWKLCKMDLRGSYRTYGNMYLILFIASAVMQGAGNSQGSYLNLATGFATIVYAATIMSLCFFFFINMMVNFYQTMFGKQAYLTQTIPASSKQLLLSKLLTGIFWIFVSLFMIAMSLLLGVVLFSIKEGDLFLFDAIKVLFGKFGGILLTLEFYKELLLGLVGLANSILFFYFIITLVHTCYVRNHRVLKGIFLGFASSYVIAIIQNVLNLGHEASYVFSILLAIGFFFLSSYLLEQKIEVN